MIGSLVLEPALIEEEKLETEIVPLPGEEPTDEAVIPEEPTLDEVVKSIVPEDGAPADVPLVPPIQPPR